MAWVRAQWDRVGAGLALAAGVLCLVLGYIGVSGTEYVSKQIPYVISDGLTGIFLLGVGTMLWLSADMRDQWRELRGLRAMLREHLAGQTQTTSAHDPLDRGRPTGFADQAGQAPVLDDVPGSTAGSPVPNRRSTPAGRS
jgi:hypothetical protein